MNKTQIVSRVHDIETKWKLFIKKRRECEQSGKSIESTCDEYLSTSKRERMFDDLLYLFWLMTDKCFREDAELKKIAFFVSKSKRLAR
jgi:hypothetical protein